MLKDRDTHQSKNALEYDSETDMLVGAEMDFMSFTGGYENRSNKYGYNEKIKCFSPT
jgi:hypothetical protein